MDDIRHQYVILQKLFDFKEFNNMDNNIINSLIVLIYSTIYLTIHSMANDGTFYKLCK